MTCISPHCRIIHQHSHFFLKVTFVGIYLRRLLLKPSTKIVFMVILVRSGVFGPRRLFIYFLTTFEFSFVFVIFKMLHSVTTVDCLTTNALTSDTHKNVYDGKCGSACNIRFIQPPCDSLYQVYTTTL